MRSKLHLLILLPTILLGACQPATTTELQNDTVTMAISHNLGDGPFFIAEAEGYFTEFGIQINYVNINETTEAVALLVSGDIDVYASSLNTGIINILSQDPSVKVVADRGHSKTGDCSYLGLVVRKDLFESGSITRAADFKGLSISATNAGSTGFLLSTYLAQGGLIFDDVEIDKLPKAAYLDAFGNKSIDAIFTVEPYLTALHKDGNSVLLVGAEDIVDVFQFGVVAFGKKLSGDPDLGTRFLAAYLKGVRQYNEGKTDRNIDILVENSGESLEVVKESCWASINLDGSVDFAGVDPFQRWSIENGYLEKGVTQDQFYDPSFLESAWKLLNQ